MTSHRLLVVDDDDGIREVATLALQVIGGWAVDTASGGEAACGTAASSPPDAVLLDVMMPGMDGPATVTRLREDPRTRHIPVIFLTAKSSLTAHPEWDGLGLAGVIAKPFDPMTLADKISDLLGWTA